MFISTDVRKHFDYICPTNEEALDSIRKERHRLHQEPHMLYTRKIALHYTNGYTTYSPCVFANSFVEAKPIPARDALSSSWLCVSVQVLSILFYVFYKKKKKLIAVY